MRRLHRSRLPFVGVGSRGEGNRSRRRLHRVGKWETVFWFSSFARGASLGGGNVEISRCVRDFQGAVGKGGNLVLVFHSFHRPGISTALLGY
jgi:hypothetical protein